jgi:hypothetical protein
MVTSSPRRAKEKIRNEKIDRTTNFYIALKIKLKLTYAETEN